MADAEDNKTEETQADQPDAANEEAVEGEGGEGDEGEEQPKSKLKLILLIAIPLLIIIIVVVVLFLTPFGRGMLGLDGDKKQEEEVVQEEDPIEKLKPAVYFDLPDLLVNLDSSKKNKNSFLKLSIYLEVADDAAKIELEGVRPKIVDTFQVYLRSLRLEDLRGSAGLQRLREELLLRANAVTGSVKVTNILFREMLIQ